MQRTVTSISITYAKTELDENNNIVVTPENITIFNETDEKKAVKEAVKKIGLFNPLKVEKVTDLYILDDEIFFKYAKKQNTSTTDKQNTSATDNG